MRACGNTEFTATSMLLTRKQEQERGTVITRRLGLRRVENIKEALLKSRPREEEEEEGEEEE